MSNSEQVGFILYVLNAVVTKAPNSLLRPWMEQNDVEEISLSRCFLAATPGHRAIDRGNARRQLVMDAKQKGVRNNLGILLAFLLSIAWDPYQPDPTTRNKWSISIRLSYFCIRDRDDDRDDDKTNETDG